MYQVVDEAYKTDPKTITALAMVSKPLGNYCQSHYIFPWLVLRGNAKFNSWFQNGCMKKHSSSVTTICYAHRTKDGTGPLPLHNSGDLIRSHFENVKGLEFWWLDLGFMEKVPNFTALGKNLHSLQFVGCDMDINQLAAYLRFFPNLKRLSMESPRFRPYARLGSLQGLPTLTHFELSFSRPDRPTDIRLLLRDFPSFPLALSKITFRGVTFTHSMDFLNGSRKTLTEIELDCESSFHCTECVIHFGLVTITLFSDHWAQADLHDLDQLARVKLNNFYLGSIPLLEKINTTNLNALLVTFPQGDLLSDCSRKWVQLDSDLVNLHDRMSCRTRPLRFYLEFIRSVLPFGFEKQARRLLPRFTANENVIIDVTLAEG